MTLIAPDAFASSLNNSISSSDSPARRRLLAPVLAPRPRRLEEARLDFAGAFDLGSAARGSDVVTASGPGFPSDARGPGAVSLVLGTVVPVCTCAGKALGKFFMLLYITLQ